MAKARRSVDADVVLGGLRFHYREWPSDNAPALVLLHGITSQAGAWSDLAQRIRDHRVIALDQRGHGRSDRAAEYSYERLVDDLAAFVDARGLRRFALGGHSMGGRAAYLYAAREQSRVKRLIVSDIGPDPGRAPVPPRLDFADFDDAFAFVRSFRPTQPEATARRLLTENLMRRADGRWAFRFDPEVFTRWTHHDPVAGWDALAAIRAPTLILRGAESDVLSRESAERMAQVIPRATLVEIPNAGHGLWYEQPEAFAAAIARFLSLA